MQRVDSLADRLSPDISLLSVAVIIRYSELALMSLPNYKKGKVVPVLN
jgi:hypothetical protein